MLRKHVTLPQGPFTQDTFYHPSTLFIVVLWQHVLSGHLMQLPLFLDTMSR